MKFPVLKEIALTTVANGSRSVIFQEAYSITVES